MPPPQAAPPYNPEEWLRILCSQTGVLLKDIPTGVREEIAVTTSKADTNKVFFAWMEARVTTMHQFTDKERELFAKAISVETSPAYVSRINNRRSLQSRVTRCLNEVNDLAVSIAHENEELRKLEGTRGVDLTSEIEAIVKDGWWKYEREATEAHNHSYGDSNDMAIAFSTPRINMNFYNKNAGVNSNVDMGRYLVKYRPRRGTIKVYEFEDNLNISDGFIHPHISSNDICWGNAAQTYSNSMAYNTPSKAMLSLRTLLQTYNDESPYRGILEFALLRNPKMFEGKNIVYVRDQRAWVNDYDLPNDIDRRYADDDNSHEEDADEERTLMRLFRAEYEGTGIRSNNYNYVAMRDGTYEMVDIYEWE